DALAENESARQVMGEFILRVIAHELVVSIKDSVSVDWMHRETARARCGFGEATFAEIWLSARRKDATVQNVLQQAEALSLEWAA
ncbi:MAG: type I restriction enzyme endonuclease domain-containing protein, partial [Pseudolabrys sp.]